MQGSRKRHAESYNLDNCFGFNENDIDLSLFDNSSVLSEANPSLEFQPNKPYRLALYVRPSVQKRLQKAKTSLLIKKTVEKQPLNKKTKSVSIIQLTEKKEAKRNARQNKLVNVMLFDENVKPENSSKKTKLTPERAKSENNERLQVSFEKKNILKEINTKSLTRTKQNKIRKSYERKFKEKEENENILDLPSEQILKEMDIKKLSRTKQKKTTKEDQEFEKWANSINSDFDDVEKFELSIAYD